jgi:hypothetical protein
MLAFFALILTFNLFNINSLWENTTIYKRFISMNVLNDVRFMAWKAILQNFQNFPLGGKQILINLNYAHNLWLDIVWTSGIYPAIFLLLFNIISIFTLIKVLLKKNIPLQLRTIILCSYCAFFIVFMFEPIIEGYFPFFLSYCFFAGLTLRLSKQNK